MITYDDLMQACHDCPYWEIASSIDNKLGLCGMCEKEMQRRKSAKRAARDMMSFMLMVGIIAKKETGFSYILDGDILEMEKEEKK